MVPVCYWCGSVSRHELDARRRGVRDEARPVEDLESLFLGLKLVRCRGYREVLEYVFHWGFGVVGGAVLFTGDTMSLSTTACTSALCCV